MTNTPPDPFGTPQQPQGHQNPGAVPPPPSPAPPAPVSYGNYGNYQGFAPDAPRGLGTATLVVTGIVTLLTLASAATAAEYAAVVVDRPIDSLDFTAHEVLSLLVLLPMIASYVVMSLWAYQANVYGASIGRRQRLHKVWAWFMWLVPFASLVLPIIYAWDFVAAKARAWVLVWWLSWLVSGIATQVGSVAIGWDGSVDPDFIQLYAPGFWVGAVFTLISFGALIMMVRAVPAEEQF